MLAVEKRIKNKKDLKDFLSVELKNYRVGKLAYWLQCTEAAVLRKHQILLRKTEYYTNTNRRIRALIYNLKLHKFQLKHCLHIAVNCCGKGLRIMHVGPILMNGNVCIGENCKIHFNTAFVAGGTSHSSPNIGDNVVIGVGATILGGVIIADNVAIGAGAVVNKDVLEPNITVGGVPSRKISNNSSANWGNGARN